MLILLLKRRGQFFGLDPALRVFSETGRRKKEVYAPWLHKTKMPSASLIIVSHFLSYIFHILPRNTPNTFVNNKSTNLKQECFSDVFHSFFLIPAFANRLTNVNIYCVIFQPFYKQKSNVCPYVIIWYYPVSISLKFSISVLK